MSIFFRILLLSAVYVCSANAAESPLNIQAISATGINNFRAPESDVLATGQPTVEQFEVMAEQGIKHVINLRTPGEDAGFDEKATVESLGMSYHSIPVSVGEGGINADNSQSLQSLLEQFGEEGVVVHCATGNRVGALISLSVFEDGGTLDDSIAEGARWGMTSERLQSSVRDTLAEN